VSVIGAIMGPVTAWRDVEQAEPEFAQRVQALFDAHRHKTVATLRADGSPRISGIETVFEDGELVFGSMPNARKGADLRRDPRFALHSATVDPVEGSEAQWPGEAKISGRAIAAGPITEGPDGDRFHADVRRRDDERADAVVPLGAGTTGDDRNLVGRGRLDDHRLGAVEHEARAVRLGGRGNPGRVDVAAALDQRERAGELTGGDGAQEPFLLLR